MAITCESKITIVRPDEKICRVETIITTDDEEPITVVIAEADLSTSEKRMLIPDIIWNKFITKRDAILYEAAIQPTLDSLEAALEINIEGRSV